MSDAGTLSWHVFVPIAALWLALLWLWARRSRPRRPGATAKIAAGAATMLLLFAPLGDAPLWSRVFSFYPNPSLPMLGLVCAGLWLRLFGLVVFRRADWHAIWIFGAIAGSALYLHPMLFGAVDLYYWGWDRALAAWTVGGLAVVFLARGSRFGVLLLATLFAYALHALESHNCWDYVMDPFYWLISVGVLAMRGILAAVRRARASAARTSAAQTAVAFPDSAENALPVLAGASRETATDASQPGS